MRQARGFTIVELMIVIAIFGILAAVAIPNFVSQMPRCRLNGAARQVMGDLMWARMQAVSENTSFTVSFLNDHEYQISGGGWSETKDIQDEYHDVTLSSTANPVFQPRGTASPWGTVTVANSSGSKDVKVHITGRVKIE